MIGFRSAALGLTVLLAAMALSRAAQASAEPYKLVRDLIRLQDAVAAGKRDAYVTQQELMGALPARLSAAGSESWKDARNRRAAVRYVLSGGAPHVLRALLNRGQFPEDEQELAKGVLAYAEGQSAEALKHLGDIDAQSLEPGLGGAIALVKSSLVAESDPASALRLLDEARLLSPGTLVEEAALRRQILSLLKTNESDRVNSLLRRYIQRFGRSYYASAFWKQFAIALAGYSSTSDYMIGLGGLLDKLDAESRGQVYLVIARQSVARGNGALVQYAAPRAARWEPNARRAALYEAAALVVTEDNERAISNLMDPKAQQLANEDADLRDAALSVARQIRRLPPVDKHGPAPIDAAESPSGELSQIGARTMERASAMVADVDLLLGEGSP